METKNVLITLTNQEPLSRNQMYEFMMAVINNKIDDTIIAGILTAIQTKGITADELLGLRDALLETGNHVDFSPFEVIDIVGTGGDGKNTFNISTCASFVVAGAGFKVAKHGNYAATSISGASNIIENHGVKFTNDNAQLLNNLEKCNFTYLHAPLFAIGMKNVAPIRKKILIPTIFNLLGPIVNPSRPKYQLLGLSNLSYIRLYQQVLKMINVHYGLVSSLDGYDEISLTGSFKIVTPNLEKIFSPSDYGFNKVKSEEIFAGKTKEEATALFDSILENKSTESQKNVVIANAATAISLIEKEKEMEECIAIAHESIESGKAYECLKQYVNLNS